jgi:hypothetical protein
MILSTMLGMIDENRDLLEDTRFTELVLAAWDDFTSLFYELYERGNPLYGWKSKVEGELGDMICAARHRGDHLKEAQRIVERLDAVIMDVIATRSEGWKELSPNQELRALIRARARRVQDDLRACC